MAVIEMRQSGRAKEKARKTKAYMEKLEGRVVGLEKALVSAFDKVEEYIKLTDARIEKLEKSKVSKPRKVKSKVEVVEPDKVEPTEEEIKSIEEVI